MPKKVTKKSRGGTDSTIAGSIGGHLCVAHFLETFSSDDVFSDIEVFHVDRGTDFGIDFVVRLHVKKRHGLKDFCFSIGIQVKNYGERSKIRRLKASRLRFIESFPGPVFLLLYRDGAKSIFIENWLIFNKDKKKQISNEEIKIESDKKEYRDRLRDRVIKECMNYVLSELSPEKHLSTYDLEDAMFTVKLLNCLKPNDDEIRILMNRVMIRSARWKPSVYEDAKRCVDLQMQKIACKRGDCPSYSDYCIHYQAALVRDEALRSKKWLRRQGGYASIRTELVDAFNTLDHDPNNLHHDDGAKARLHRFGLSVLSMIIMLDLAQGSCTYSMEWEKLYSKLCKMVGTILEESSSNTDSLRSVWGLSYQSFVKLAKCKKISRICVEKWLKKNLMLLDKRCRYRDSDEDAAVYFLSAGLYMKTGDMKAASTQVDLAAAIARVQKSSLWIHPIDYVRERIKRLRKKAKRRDK